MTNEERDRYIMETHDAIIRLVPKVEDHSKTLYGNGKPGLKEELALVKIKQNDCPARNAYSGDNKRLNVSYVMMIVAIIAVIVNIVLSMWKK